jgi:hypothetical protein
LDVCAISREVERKKEDTVVTSRSGERNELYHTAGISIGKREARARKPLYPILCPVAAPRRAARAVLVFHFGFGFGFGNVTRASAGSADVKIFINCVPVLVGRGDDTLPGKVGWCT